MLQIPPIDLHPDPLGPTNPSIKDGLECSEVLAKHRQSCKFIYRVGRRLLLPIRTISTAQVFFHKYFLKRSFSSSIDPSDIALTAILVAAKAEETYKRIKEILIAAFIEMHPDHDHDQLVIGEEQRASLAKYEEEMLQLIDFQFINVCPFHVLVKVGKQLDATRDNLKCAWETLEDMMTHPSILSYPILYICMAAFMNNVRSSHQFKDVCRHYNLSLSVTGRVHDSLLKV